MISYIQHDKEFFGVIKLTNGEEIVGEMICTEDIEEKNKGTSMIFISNPGKIKQVEVAKEQQVGVGIAIIKWHFFSEEEFYIVTEKDIISIAPLSKTGIFAYKNFLRGERGMSESDSENGRTMNKDMGSLGTVGNARNLLEKMYRAPSSDKKKS
tara:strand:+ start:3771 stop:4232 length:462 start_codon:yes stop_codon:yes gene_type:complete